MNKLERFETIHLTDRVVLVDKEENIKNGDFFLNELQEIHLAIIDFLNHKYLHKIIAAKPPIGDLPLLPEMELDEVAFANQINTQGEHKLPYNEGRWYGRIEGFKAAKELYPFSKEDMIEFAQYLQNCCINPIGDNKFGDGEDVYSGEQCLQLYLNQKPKPQFIPEIELKSTEFDSSKPPNVVYEPKIDKTTNTLIGKWV